MTVETFHSAAEVDSSRMPGVTAVVIDVIRATSTIVEALASGASAVYPTLSSEEAIRMAQTLGREDTLLCGERKGLRIEGFDLGNSPQEFTPERVAGQRLVMSTTNGTRAFLAAEGADRVVAASLTNLSSVSGAIVESPRIVFVCAGKEGRFSLDDALCAGLIIEQLLDRVGAGQSSSVETDDASKAALALARSYEVDAQLLQRTAAGDALVKVGLEADLKRCADVDRHALVPEMKERIIRLSHEA